MSCIKVSVPTVGRELRVLQGLLLRRVKPQVPKAITDVGGKLNRPAPLRFASTMSAAILSHPPCLSICLWTLGLGPCRLCGTMASGLVTLRRGRPFCPVWQGCPHCCRQCPHLSGLGPHSPRTLTFACPRSSKTRSWLPFVTPSLLSPRCGCSLASCPVTRRGDGPWPWRRL